MTVIKFQSKKSQELSSIREDILGERNALNIGLSVQFIMSGFNTEETHGKECQRLRDLLTDILSTDKGVTDFYNGATSIVTTTLHQGTASDLTPVEMCVFTVETPGQQQYQCELLMIGSLMFIKSLTQIIS